MIGQALEANRPFPKGAIVLFALALALVVLSAGVGTIHWAVAAVFPCMWGITLWLFREPAFSGQFTETAFVINNPSLTVPYEKLQGLWAKGRKGDPTRPGRRSFPMQVAHEDGLVYIPANLNVPSEDVYQFLYSHFSPSGSRQVNSQLARYLAVEEEAFGAERVWTYRAREYLAKPFGARKVRAFSLALLFSSPVWIALGPTQKDLAGWICPGLSALFIGFALFLGSFLMTQTGPRGIRHRRQASLVISPGGMAMIQGESKGEMGWDELLDVKWNPIGSQVFALTSSDVNPPGILLVFEGAKVSIADIYDRPLPIIYKRIAQCWRETEGDLSVS
jgi:hypothetical protein